MSDWLPDYKSGFQQDLQGLADTVGDTRLELGYLGRADGTSTIVNTSRAFNREMFYYGKVGGRPTPFGSARLSESAGIFYEDSADNLDLPVWIVNRKGVRTIVQVVIPEGVDQSGASAGQTPLEKRIAAGGGANTALSNLASVAINTSLVSDTDIVDDLGSATVRWHRVFSEKGIFDCLATRVKNTSGGTVSEGKVGYIERTAGSGAEFKTTTTANLVTNWCVVVEGGANNADIWVSNFGVVTVELNANCSAGDLLVTSTTAGRAGVSTVMRYDIFALALTANGSGAGGTCVARLLCSSAPLPASNSNDVLVTLSQSTTLWTGTINGTPTATGFTVTTSTGSLNCVTPLSTTELGKYRMRNTTRGTNRLITAVSGLNVTNVSVTDSWANGDALTIESGTTVSGFSNKYIEVDISGSQPIPIPSLARALKCVLYVNDSSLTTPASGSIHPLEAYSESKRLLQNSTSLTGVYNPLVLDVLLIGGVFTFSMNASGSGTANHVLRLVGYTLAKP